MTTLHAKMDDVTLQAKAPQILKLARKLDPLLAEHGLGSHTANVALMLDYSASMRNFYGSWAVQTLVERVLPLAVRFDDNAEIDVFFFPNRSQGERCYGVTPDNFEGCVKRITANHEMGSTPFDQAFKQVFDHYGFAGKKGTPRDIPVYLLFVTDGAPDNSAVAIQSIERAATYPMFTQFIAIGEDWPKGDDLRPSQTRDEAIPVKKKGNWLSGLFGGGDESAQATPRTSGMKFLVQLDEDMDTEIDAVNAFAVENPAKVNETRLYDLMFREYPLWLPEAKKAGLIL